MDGNEAKDETTCFQQLPWPGIEPGFQRDQRLGAAVHYAPTWPHVIGTATFKQVLVIQGRQLHRNVKQCLPRSPSALTTWTLSVSDAAS